MNQCGQVSPGDLARHVRCTCNRVAVRHLESATQFDVDSIFLKMDLNSVRVSAHSSKVPGLTSLRL